jgi:hypothetical protein
MIADGENLAEEVRRQIAAEDRDQRRLLLDEWRLSVQTPLDAGLNVRQHAVSYAQIGLKSAFLINGGALVALPPLMQWLPAPERVMIPSCALYFVFGLSFAGLCSLITYINFLIIGAQYDANADVAALKLAVAHKMRDAAAFEDKSYKKSVDAPRRLSFWVNATLCGGVGTGVASYVMFLWGVFTFSHIVK